MANRVFQDEVSASNQTKKATAQKKTGTGAYGSGGFYDPNKTVVSRPSDSGGAVTDEELSGSELAAEIAARLMGVDPDEEQSFNDEFFWQDAVIDKLEDDIKGVAKTYDLDLDYLLGWFGGQKDALISYLENDTGLLRRAGLGPDPITVPGTVNNLIEAGRLWLGNYIPNFYAAIKTSGAGGRGSGSGRSRGGGGPTAAEIRAQFDVNEMVQRIQDASRGLILAEYDGAAALANTYIDMIVKNPEQQLDFNTFVRGKILGSARAKVLYKSKPESMSEEQYLQPYVQSAMQMIGPGYGEQLGEIASGGAMLNADPNAFRARLQRTSQVQSSAPFLKNLGDQISGIKGVLR